MMLSLKTKKWILVPPPKRRNIIDSKRLFRVKELFDGTLDKLKESVVVKVFVQVAGFEYYFFGRHSTQWLNLEQ